MARKQVLQRIHTQPMPKVGLPVPNLNAAIDLDQERKRNPRKRAKPMKHVTIVTKRAGVIIRRQKFAI